MTSGESGLRARAERSTGRGNATVPSPEPREGRPRHRQGPRLRGPTGHIAETWLLESISSLPQLHRQGTELSPEGPRGPPRRDVRPGRHDRTATGIQLPSPLYLHSGFPQPVSGLCPSEQGVIIQLPPGASGPLSAEKFSLRLGPLALCHLWAEDTGKPTLHAGDEPHACKSHRRLQFNVFI